MLELLIVVAVIGILSAISVPSFLTNRKVVSDATMTGDLGRISMNVSSTYYTSPGRNAPMDPSMFPEATVSDGSSWGIVNEGQNFCISLWRDEAPDKLLNWESNPGVCSNFGKTGKLLIK